MPKQLDDASFLRYLQKAVNACVEYACEKVGVPVFTCSAEILKSKTMLGHTKSSGYGSDIAIAINKNGFLALSEREQAAVLIHEVCHGIVFHYVKRPSSGDSMLDSHGPTWRAAMKKCGMDPDDTLKGVV